jgi:hypothetical protein
VPALPDEETPDRRRREITLPPGHLVAKFEELNDDALQARLALRPGGHNHLVDYQRGAAIEFLRNAPMLEDLSPELRERNTGFDDPDAFETTHTGMSAEEQIAAAGVSKPKLNRVAQVPVKPTDEAFGGIG